MPSALFIHHLAADSTDLALLRRMALAGVPVVVLTLAEHVPQLVRAAQAAALPLTVDAGATLTAKRLLLALRAAGADGATSWLITTDAAVIAPAAQAGLAGVVLLNTDAPADDRLVVARADSLADAPRVMLPRGGGCWHDHRST